MNHVRVEVSWCSCYTLYSLQGIKQEHQQSRVRISNLLLLFLVFLFPLFSCCVFFFFVVLRKVLPAKKSWNQHIDFCTFCGTPDTGAWQRERPQRLDTGRRRRRRRCWRVYLVSVYRSICVLLYLLVPPCYGVSLFGAIRSSDIFANCFISTHVLMSPAVPAVPGRQTTISLYAAVG